MTVYRVFYDGFESYSVGDLPSPWEEGPNSTGPTQVVTSALDAGLGPPAGSKMARVNWQTGSPQQTGMRYSFASNWGGSDRLFVRFRYRCDADMPSNLGGIHAFRFFVDSGCDFYFPGNSDSTYALENLVDDVRIFGGQISLGNVSSFNDTSQFHTLEFYFKRSATTHATVWRNGSIITGGGRTADASGFSYTDAKFARVDLTSNWSGGAGNPPDNNNHIYVDEFEVFADATWGLGWDDATTGMMEDATIQAAAGGSSPRRGSTMSLRY